MKLKKKVNKLKKYVLFRQRYYKANKTEKLFVKNLKISQSSLKNINWIKTNSEKEYILTGATSTSVALPHQEKIAEYGFVVSIIGLIDYKIEEIKAEMKKTFLEKDEIYELAQQENIYNNARKSFVQDILKMMEIHIGTELLIETIGIQPSYLNFPEVYKDATENYNFLLTQYEFINAYNRGFKASRDIKDVIFIYDVYDALYFDLDSYKNKNSRSLQELKNKKINDELKFVKK